MYLSEAKRGSLLLIVLEIKLIKSKPCAGKDGELETFGKYAKDYTGINFKIQISIKVYDLL